MLHLNSCSKNLLFIIFHFRFNFYFVSFVEWPFSIAILGDSIPKYVSSIPDTDVFALRGASLCGMSKNILDFVKEKATLFTQYNVWIVHVGTNDVEFSTPEQMLDKIKLLIQSLQSVSVEPYIFLSSILPRPKDFATSNGVICRYHELVKACVLGMPRVKLIPSYKPFFEGPRYVPHMFSMNCLLHPSRAGTEALRSFFCSVLTPFRRRTSDPSFIGLQNAASSGEGSRVAPVLTPFRYRTHDPSFIGLQNAASSGEASRAVPGELGPAQRGQRRRLNTTVMRGQKAVSRLSRSGLVGQPQSGKTRFERVQAGTGSTVSSQFFQGTDSRPVNVKGPKDPGSNFWGEELFFKGRWFSNAEQCYQCHKAWINGNPGKANLMLKQTCPFSIKSLGGKVNIVEPQWEQIKINLMWQILSNKFSQSGAFRLRLAKTGRSPLIHIVDDTFWGTGLLGEGLNHFGHLLEFFRSRLP